MDDKVGDLLQDILPKALKVNTIHKGINNTNKAITGYSTFKAEHEHLVPVRSLLVIHNYAYEFETQDNK
jgi:hypothetical protein